LDSVMGCDLGNIRAKALERQTSEKSVNEMKSVLDKQLSLRETYLVKTI
jgi:hypothetical protein